MPEIDLKELKTEMNGAFIALKEKLEKQDEEIRKNGAPLAETKETIDKIQKSLDEIELKHNAKLDELEKKNLDRLDAIETKLNRTGGEGSEKSVEALAKKEAFIEMLRKGGVGMTPEKLKLLATDSDTDGGYLVPTTTQQGIVEKLVEMSPVRAVANVVTLSQGDTLEVPKEGAVNFAEGWTSERATVTETTSGTVALETITAHEQYAEPRATQKMIDDAAFDIEGWINRKLAERFGVSEGAAFISGTGVGRPFGLLNATAGVTEVVSGNATLITADGLLDLFFDLPEFYASNATWLLKRSTIRDIRKLKDLQNQYLWAPGLAGGTPATILNRPYREAIDMPAVATGSNPVIFGDFRAGYTIVDRQQIRMLRDNLTSKPFVKFYATRRVGGKVVLPEALRKMKISV